MKSLDTWPTHKEPIACRSLRLFYLQAVVMLLSVHLMLLRLAGSCDAVRELFVLITLGGSFEHVQFAWILSITCFASFLICRQSFVTLEIEKLGVWILEGCLPLLLHVCWCEFTWRRWCVQKISHSINTSRASPIKCEFVCSLNISS